MGQAIFTATMIQVTKPEPGSGPVQTASQKARGGMQNVMQPDCECLEQHTSKQPQQMFGILLLLVLLKPCNHYVAGSSSSYSQHALDSQRRRVFQKLHTDYSEQNTLEKQHRWRAPHTRRIWQEEAARKEVLTLDK